jgi:hypothetical protein
MEMASVKKIWLVMCLVLSIALISASLRIDVGRASESEEVVAVQLNPGYYVDDKGTPHVVGEVQNVGPDMLEKVRIEVDFFDSEDNVLDTAYNYIEIDTLLPQQKSPFDVKSGGFTPAWGILARFGISVHSYEKTSRAPYQDFTFQVTNNGSIGDWWYWIDGEVVNIGQKAVTFVEAVATLYDGDGNVVGVVTGYADPMNMSAGESGSFSLDSFPNKCGAYVDDYSLQVQSKLLTTSSISCSVTSNSVKFGSSTTVSGSITPPRSGVIITLSYMLPNDTVIKRNVSSTSDGSYSDTYTPSVPGNWKVTASWEGDSTYEGAASSEVSFTVTKISTTLSCTASPSEVAEGNSITVSGAIGPALSGKTVALTYKKADGKTVTRTATTGSDGSYSDSYRPDAIGLWSVTASWNGDSTYEAASSPSKSFTVKEKSGCLIATATYGSELSPNVQFLRGFRDNTVLSTFAGSGFMTAFNRFYYSFSPTVASTISSNEVLRGLIKVVLYPLIGILHLSSTVFTLFSFSSELGVVMAGLVASALLATVYVMPWILMFSFLHKFKPSKRIIRLSGLVWTGSVLAIAIAEVSTSPLLMMASTGTFVLATMTLTTLALTKTITGRRIN